MKKVLLLIVLVCASMVSCEETNQKNQSILSDSSGNINNISVIMDNEMWRDEVGEAVRKNLAAPVEGLPQEEPLFSMNQMPPEAFLGFMRKNRNFLKIEKGPAGIEVRRDPYARPQTGIFIFGENKEEVVALINENSSKIVNTFKNTEIREKQRRIKKSLKDDTPLQDSLGVSLNFPTAYRYAIQEDNFFWMRKDIKNGGMNILVFEIPYNSIDKDSSIVSQIIKIRDSIGEKYVHGVPEGTHMITEKAYAPYMFETEINKKFAYETKGTWELKDAFMAGPFVNYVVDDKSNNRYVVLEGFTFAPSAFKRDNMFELEAILRTAKIK